MTEETNEFRTVLLTPRQVLSYWNSLEGPIEKALAVGVGEMTSFDVCNQAINGHLQVWVTLDSHSDLCCVSVTRVVTYPSTRHLQIVCLTIVKRTASELKGQFHTFERFAKSQGCQSLQVWGRKGWQRKLKSLPSIEGNKFKTLYYVFDQEI